MGAAVELAVSTIFTSTAVWAVAIRTILVNVILSAIAKSLAPDATNYTPPINVTTRGTVENRRLVFGVARAGGAVVFMRAGGTGGNFLYYVIALAGHQVSAITDVFIDKKRIRSSEINGSTGAVTSTTDGYNFNGKLYIWKYLGTQAQTVDATLTAAFPPVWDSAHKLRGTAYIVVRCERDATVWPNGAPQDITAIVNGALVYDPRLDSTNGGSGTHRMSDPSTWAYSRNPALIARWFLTGGSVVNDQGTRLIRYGLKEADARINDAYVIAAANKCDEVLTGANTTPTGDQTRYQCDGEFSTGESRRLILTTIIASMAGTITYVNGQWRVQAGQYDAPLHTVTQADLFGDVEVQDTLPANQRYNSVSGVYRDDSMAYVEATTPYRTNAAYQTQDGGEQITRELDFRAVSNNFRTQRLCEIELRKSRLMRTVAIYGGTNLLKIAPNETFTLTIPRFGWNAVLFRCVERQFDFGEAAARVKITAQIDDSSIWTDLITADYIMPSGNGPITQLETPDPPTGLNTQGIQNAIIVRWTASNMLGVAYEVEESTSSSMTSPTVVYNGPDNQCVLTKTVTTTFYYRVRARRSGLYSTYEPASGGISGAVASIGTGLAATVSPGTASASGTTSSLTTGSVTVIASGGTPAYTYAWTWLSGGTGITINSASAATTSFTAASITAGATLTGTARCTVTDAAAATKTVDVSVTITRTAAMSASASPSSFVYYPTTTPYTTPSTTATPSGGTPAYTYAWSWAAGGTGLTINSPTSASTTVTMTGAVGVERTGTLRCTITDSASNTATCDVNVDITHSP